MVRTFIFFFYLYSTIAFSQQLQYYKTGNKIEYMIGEQPMVSSDENFMIFVGEDTNIATKNIFFPNGKPFKTFYQALRINDTLWTRPIELTVFTEYDTINKKYRSTSVGTPFITKGKYLFFSRYYMTTFTGIPQKDIFYSFCDNALYSLPISIDSINTGLEETSPILLRDTLYFLHRDINNCFLGRSCREKKNWHIASYFELPNFIKKPHLQIVNNKLIIIYEHSKTKKIYLANITLKNTTIELTIDSLLTVKNKFKNSIISITENNIYGSIRVKKNKKDISIISRINLLKSGKTNLLQKNLKPIFFDKQQFTINDFNKEILKNIVLFMQENTKIKIQIIGYADINGSASYNLELSKKRAAMAKTYLISLGIDANRLETIGYGEKHQNLSNNTTQNKDIYRRVEFKIVE